MDSCKEFFHAHLDHSIFLFCHSYKSPIAKTVINRVISIMFFLEVGSKGYEITKAISTSKIKNRRATKKNWKEKGMWEGFITLNPHSNWPQVSFLLTAFFCTICTRVMKSRWALGQLFIELWFLFFFFLFNWKLNVPFYTIRNIILSPPSINYGVQK